jgi:hypothetical protein
VVAVAAAVVRVFAAVTALPLVSKPFCCLFMWLTDKQAVVEEAVR